jgi:hypothetical protein
MRECKGLYNFFQIKVDGDHQSDNILDSLLLSINSMDMSALKTRDGDKHHVKSEPGGCQLSSGRRFLPNSSETPKENADHLVRQ